MKALMAALALALPTIPVLAADVLPDACTAMLDSVLRTGAGLDESTAITVTEVKAKGVRSGQDGVERSPFVAKFEFAEMKGKARVVVMNDRCYLRALKMHHAKKSNTPN